MFSRQLLASVFLIATFALLTACGGNQAKQESAAVKSVDDRFSITVGAKKVQIQIAAENAEMQKGLMYRKSMGADEGMLFLYGSPQQMSFWMRNTELPLDIGFFDASGELREVYQMYPHDERAVSSHAKNLQFALEMNQGWYKQADVKPGAKLDLKAVVEALKARGLKPETFGLN